MHGRHVRAIGLIDSVVGGVRDGAGAEMGLIEPKERMKMTMRSKPTSGARAERKSRVTLVVPIGQADEVVATGDFTDRSPEGVPLKRRRDGAWSRTLYLQPGRYEYRLLVDGHWGNNPAAEHSGNPYGSANDVLIVS
jgi:hypothetical protein